MNKKIVKNVSVSKMADLIEATAVGLCAKGRMSSYGTCLNPTIKDVMRSIYDYFGEVDCVLFFKALTDKRFKFSFFHGLVGSHKIHRACESRTREAESKREMKRRSSSTSVVETSGELN